MLEQGIDAWNQWRKEHPYILPDLSEIEPIGADFTRAELSRADLHNVNLRKADLGSANLSEADLSEADLTDADLRGADLKGANLTAADLDGADLYAADLYAADLIGANLRRANLTRTDLTVANLSMADFSDAKVGMTQFGHVDLSTVKGLETVRQGFPSTVGIDTIYQSKGKIPDVFLRGAGIPEKFIEYMHSLTGEAFEYYSCFISYSKKDQPFADRLYADLQAKSVRCWLATEDLKTGDKFRQRIDEAIRQYDKLVVVLSKTSMKSDWVESEVETALEKERDAKGKKLVLFPIRLDGAVMKTKQAWAGDIRRKRHIGDFRNWQDHNVYRKAFQRLLRDLAGRNGKEAAVE